MEILKKGYNGMEYAAFANEANKQGKVLVKLQNGDITIEAPIEQSFEKTKLQILAEINAVYEYKASSIIDVSTESEILTWNTQRNEALAYAKDNRSETPFIDNLAVSRQIDKDALIGKILARINTFNSDLAILTGKRQYYKDKISKAQTIDELTAIQWQDE